MGLLPRETSVQDPCALSLQVAGDLRPCPSSEVACPLDDCLVISEALLNLSTRGHRSYMGDKRHALRSLGQTNMLPDELQLC